MTQRTYWHLESLDRRPAPYDVGTSELLYYPSRGFEVRTPIAAWYERHQKQSSLRARSWERFRDPQETTYARYTETRHDREVFVDGLFASAAAMRGRSKRWPPAGRLVATLRFPVHGLQMACAYVGQLAPSGRIVVACAFQAADEVRRIQRLAYRTRELELEAAGGPESALAAQSKERWLREPGWQPLRKLVETLLVTYDFGEALVALNAVIKPAFDEVFHRSLSARAEDEGDELLARVLLSLHEDSRWQREWTIALLRMCVDDFDDNRPLVAGWIERWRAPAIEALESAWSAETGGPSIAGEADDIVASMMREAGVTP